MSLTGQQIGPFTVGQRLGAGGMAEVYEGHSSDVQLGRRVAIKVLRAELCNNTEMVNRFVNEARALGRINHPGVVHIYDIAYLSDQRVCLIMEFLGGMTLAKWLKQRGALSVQEAVPIMIQLADTMAAAHDQKIIHRDVKPDNIFVVSDPVTGIRTKVLDFGVAKLLGNAGAVQTRTQTTLGTAAYMPPEQFRSSKDVDHRSDIYSLGCVYFELIAGRPPFVANTLVDHMRMHAFEQPPTLRQVVPNAPAEMEQIISATLVKDPGGRYGSMRELQQDLQRFQSGVRPTGPQRAQAKPQPAPYAGPHPHGRYPGPQPNPHPAPGSGPNVQASNLGEYTAQVRPIVVQPGYQPVPGQGKAERRGMVIAVILIAVVIAVCAALVIGFS